MVNLQARAAASGVIASICGGLGVAGVWAMAGFTWVFRIPLPAGYFAGGMEICGVGMVAAFAMCMLLMEEDDYACLLEDS